jgi:hypothetical protein
MMTNIVSDTVTLVGRQDHCIGHLSTEPSRGEMCTRQGPHTRLAVDDATQTDAGIATRVRLDLRLVGVQRGAEAYSTRLWTQSNSFYALAQLRMAASGLRNR